MFILKQNHVLTAAERDDLKQLNTSSFLVDKTTEKIYWDLLAQPRSIQGNFLYYHDHTLIAYLSIFLFEEHAAQISALVHPLYRRQGIFSKLLQASLTELKKHAINEVIFVCEQNNVAAKNCLQAKGAIFSSMEFHMQTEIHAIENFSAYPLSCRRAQFQDLELIAKLDHDCFNSNYFLQLEHFRKTINEPHRQVWLAYVDHHCIGKIHFKHENATAIIHDVGILPLYQKQGYGKKLLLWSLHYLSQTHLTMAKLEVTASNESALQLYKKCGFSVQSVEEYWRLKF